MVGITVVLMIVLMVALVGSAVAKFTKVPRVIDSVRSVGVADRQIPVLGGIEIVGAVGLTVGIFVPWVGVIAAVGVLAYFALAAASHVRVGDAGEMIPAAALAVLSLIVLVLRVVTL